MVYTREAMSTPISHSPSPGLLQRVRNYARPRPGTSGDLPSSSTASGVLAGGIQGYVSGGVLGAASGALGGYVGVKAGEKAGSMAVAVGAGTATGAAIGALSLNAMSAMVGGPVGLGLAASGAVIGGFAGAVGTLSGSRRAVTRDSVYGGMLGGAMAAAWTGNPAMMIAGAAGAGIGGRAAKPAGRLVLGALAGAATGAVAGVMGGPPAMIAGAVAGAVIGPVGTLVGPAVRQIQRNLTADLTTALNKRVEPWIEKHPLGLRGKLVAGAVMGSLVVGPLGLLFGLPGLAVTTAVGAVGGAVRTWRFLKKKEQAPTPPAPQVGTGAPRTGKPQAEPAVRLGAPVELLRDLAARSQAGTPGPQGATT